VLHDSTQPHTQAGEWQRRVLEAIATGVELRDVLTSIALSLEAQCAGTECAVHLVDDDGVTLRTASAPSMKQVFVDAMDEIVIGPTSATCGVSAYRRALVTTSDIGTDPIWNDYRALADEQGYRACWAAPIRAPQGRLLGALVAYTRTQGPPSPAQLRITEAATQLAGIAVDRSHAGESLRQSEASFRSFVENSPIGIYRATSAGRLLAVNASLVKLLGFDSDDELLAVDLRHDLFASTTDRDRFMRQLQENGEVTAAESEWRRKDGTTVTVRISARAYRDERGSVWFSEGFVEDVTPLRAVEQALRQSEKLAALGRLVSGVAHELNNPLASILHFAEDLLDDQRTAEDLEALSIIRDQARRSRAIVRDLLAFVRMRETPREPVRLADALQASIRALKPAVNEIGATLLARVSSTDIVALTDRAGLQQIVTNLVMNGAQASGPGGEVVFRADITRSELRIIVEDSGPGIPSDVMERIFEPFFTTKPIGEGTGLGLSVTLGLVQHVGGRIDVANREGGANGARFTVVLPIDLAESPEANESTPVLRSPASVAARAGRPGPRVLVIDDEPTIRLGLRRFFTRRGWRVDEAADGAEGLSALLAERFAYAAVVSDLKMPGCSGIELHDHVAAVAPELLDRIVFSTGDVASPEAAEFVRRTRCKVLQKPFELRALEAILVRMVRRAASA
jgi:PAS domain S-box-containing protein